MEEKVLRYEDERKKGHLGEPLTEHLKEELYVYRVAEINDEGKTGGKGSRGWQFDVRCAHTPAGVNERTVIYHRSEVLMKTLRDEPAIAEGMRKGIPFYVTVYPHKNYFLPYDPTTKK